MVESLSLGDTCSHCFIFIMVFAISHMHDMHTGHAIFMHPLLPVLTNFSSLYLFVLFGDS